MKKLITLASVAAVACGLQAASYTWGFSSPDIQDTTGEYMDGGTAFFYLGTVTADANAFDTSSATFIASAGQNDGTYDYGSPTTPISGDEVPSIAAGQSYSLILLEETGVASLDGYTGNYILYTGTTGQPYSDSDPSDPTSMIQYANFVSDTAYGASDWATMEAGGAPDPGPTPGVPEPTSGLLLVMGLAGLALKRKNA